MEIQETYEELDLEEKKNTKNDLNDRNVIGLELGVEKKETTEDSKTGGELSDVEKKYTEDPKTCEELFIEDQRNMAIPKTYEELGIEEKKKKRTLFMLCCRATRHLRVRVFCVLIIFYHITVVDYQMAIHKDIAYLGFLAIDVITIILFIASFTLSCFRFNGSNAKLLKKTNIWIDVLSWFLYSATVMIKSIIIFSDFEEENLIFGPNSVKTAFAVVGVVFVLHLSTLHDAKPDSVRKAYIKSLSISVIYDILDCVDSMEPLFIKEDREELSPGLIKAIVTVASLNFVLPTIPLVTLSLTQFGQGKLPRRLILLHKIILAYIINLPLLVIRLFLWHEFDQGISVFSLKNLIVIVAMSYKFYKHYEKKKLKDQDVEDKAEIKPDDVLTA